MVHSGKGHDDDHAVWSRRARRSRRIGLRGEADVARPGASKSWEWPPHGRHRRHPDLSRRHVGVQQVRIRALRLTAARERRGWALVTGASRRIGRVLATTCAEAGFDVLVHHRHSPDDAETTAAEVRRKGRAALVRARDLSDPDAPRDLLAAPPSPITLLVNNASRFDDDRIASLSPPEFDAILAVNLRSPVLLAQAFASALPAPGRGLIVNILDQRVWRLTPQFFSYTISKAALWAATQTLAQALAPRVRVNAIGPGPTLANIYQAPGDFAAEASALPLERSVDPDQIGQALRYLIDAASVTGQMIAVDGGQHLAWRTPDVHGD